MREVEDPASPAVAFVEDGRIVVEVDAKLKGRERSRAIWTAMRAHEGRLPALLPFLLLMGWEPIQRWLRDQAALAAMATATGSVSLLLLVPTAHHHEDPPQVASPAATITVTASTSTTGPATTQSPTPARSATPSVQPPAVEGESGADQRDPTVTGPPETRQATAAPTRSPTGRAPSPRPSPSDFDVTTPPPQASEAPAAARASQDLADQETTAPVDEPTVAPRPEPTPASAGRDCLLRVDLDPLADACVLG